MIKRLLICAVVLISMVGCSKKEEKNAPEGQNGSVFISAEYCRECHKAIYSEWKSSMHAKSAPMSDKVFAKLFNMSGNDTVIGRRNGKPLVCINCHVPTAALDDEVDLTKEPIYSEGVTCTFCHKIKSIKDEKGRALGAKAYEFNSGEIYSASLVDAKSDAHETSFNPLFSKSEFCSGCHEKRMNENGLNLCTTYEEFKLSGKAKSMSCQDCHMPEREGRVASSSDVEKKMHFHGSTGGHDIDRVRSVIGLDIELNKESNSFSVIAQNKNAAHKLPTSLPLRQIILKVIQFDERGSIVKENFRNTPMEDKNALFIVAFKDGNGNIMMSSKDAESIAFDNRINPHGDRVIIYDLASGNVAKIRAELYYRLVPEVFAKNGDIDEYAKESHLIAIKEINVK